MPAVLDLAALVVVGVNLPFAVYGYLLFGAETQGETVPPSPSLPTLPLFLPLSSIPSLQHYLLLLDSY